MDKRDVLVSDIRITALADSGQYVFEWVDENQKLVTFNPTDSDFDEVPDSVVTALRENGLNYDNSTVSEENEQKNKKPEKPKSMSEPEPIGESTSEIGDSETDEIEPISPINPTKTDEEEVNNKSQLSENSEIDVENTTDESTTPNSPSESTNERISFMVRMTDPSDREKIVENLKETNPEAAKKLQLSGPYQVTYEVQNNSLEIVGVEDLGIGSKSGDIN